MEYYNKGKVGELDFCRLLRTLHTSAILTDDLDLQYKDIDCIMKDGRTVSVKDQSQADKYNCFLFEYLQVRTSDNAKVVGNIHNCEADLYAICSPSTWFVLNAPALKEFIDDNDFKSIRTTNSTEAHNRLCKGLQGYDRTYSYVVTFKQLEDSGALLWKGKRV